MTRNNATVAGLTSSNRLTATTAPVYCAAAEKRKKISGGAVSKKRAGRLLEITRTIEDLCGKSLAKVAES